MIPILTTCSLPDLHKCERLINSARKQGREIIVISHDWKGFGDKILETRNYLNSHPEITSFLYTDAWDTLVTNSLKWIDAVIGQDAVLSAERGCYPHPDKAVLYPETKSPFKYVNGGGWYFKSDVFKDYVNTNHLTTETVDQVWFTDLYLKHPDKIKLDVNCEVFQTIAFCPETDFKIDGERVTNTITNTTPLFIHGNGHTPLTQFESLWT